MWTPFQVKKILKNPKSHFIQAQNIHTGKSRENTVTLLSGVKTHMSDSHSYIKTNLTATLCITHCYKAAVKAEWTP